MDQIEEIIREKEGANAVYHKFRTRKSASRRYVEFHLLMPGDLSVRAAHDRCTAIETEIRSRLPKTRVTIHIEPAETGGV
jgi:divalent metal cation (Fe/Co/Zn/Cd) transporter